MEIIGIFKEYGHSSMKCEASSSVGGGGKSVSMLTKQRDRIVKKMKDRYDRMKESGNFTKAQLAEARKNFIRVRNTANSYVRQATTAIAGKKAKTSDLTKEQTWTQVDRSIYTNGKMGVTKAGQAGQFRDARGRGSANGGGTESTRGRRRNQGAFGATVGRSYNIQNKMDVMRRGNRSMFAGVIENARAKYTTNNAQTKEVINERKGLTGRSKKRATSNTTNRSRYEARQLTSSAKINRYERRKAKYASRAKKK